MELMPSAMRYHRRYDWIVSSESVQIEKAANQDWARRGFALAAALLLLIDGRFTNVNNGDGVRIDIIQILFICLSRRADAGRHPKANSVIFDA